MNIARFTSLLLLAALVLAAGCTTVGRNPLESWRFSSITNLDSNKAITDDYQSYIQKLSAEERKFVGGIKFFEDGMGQYAVEITIDLHGTWWKHVLIYDGNNKRTKVIKYKFGNYRS
jgi:hypothetical protein